MSPLSSLEMWGSWPACERLGMCCVEKSPFPLVVGPYAPTLPCPSTSPELAHKHTPFYQHSRHPHPLPTVPPLANTPDNWQQLRWWTQCVGQGSSAGLTPHLTLGWPLACESSSLKAALPIAWRSLSLYLLSPHTSLPGRTHAQRRVHPQVSQVN